MREVTLPYDTRMFQRVNEQSPLLARTGKMIRAGTTLRVSDPVLMTYDHRDQLAVSFQHEGEEHFFIVTEMEVAGFVH